MRPPRRIEDPDPPLCTCTDVRSWLVSAFMALPTTPIFSTRTGAGMLLDITSFDGIPTFEIIPVVTSLLDAQLCCSAGEIQLPVGAVAKGYIHLSVPKRLARIRD